MFASDRRESKASDVGRVKERRSRGRYSFVVVSTGFKGDGSLLDDIYVSEMSREIRGDRRDTHPYSSVRDTAGTSTPRIVLPTLELALFLPAKQDADQKWLDRDRRTLAERRMKGHDEDKATKIGAVRMALVRLALAGDRVGWGWSQKRCW